MSRIRFATTAGIELGHATLDGDAMTCDPAVEGIVAQIRRRAGDVKAFRFFSDWSNGYVVASLVD